MRTGCGRRGGASRESSTATLGRRGMKRSGGVRSWSGAGPSPCGEL
jgi:hypothetical protein